MSQNDLMFCQKIARGSLRELPVGSKARIAALLGGKPEAKRAENRQKKDDGNDK